MPVSVIFLPSPTYLCQHPCNITAPPLIMHVKKEEPTIPEHVSHIRPSDGELHLFSRSSLISIHRQCWRTLSLRSPFRVNALSSTDVDDELEYWQGLEEDDEVYLAVDMSSYNPESTSAPPVISNCWVRQEKSRQGYVAYVVFYGAYALTRTAAFAAIGSDEHHSHKGFLTLDAAHHAWDTFRWYNILPESTKMPCSTQAPHTPPCGLSAPRLHHAYTTPPLNTSPSYTHRSHPATTPSNNVLNYFAVFTGVAPGVYHGRQATQMGMGHPSAAT
ncbi:hypothetical protein BYT27DRAFT_7255211 [Phlegmacium glaucopus]|nr:hypothetical protein BYT27DRAFT_7255211 [Phlegmacium glaucopus]